MLIVNIENCIKYFSLSRPSASFIVVVDHIFWKPASCRASRSDKSWSRKTKRPCRDWNNERSSIRREKRGEPTPGKEWRKETSHNRRDKCCSSSCCPVVGLTRLLEKKRRSCVYIRWKGQGRARCLLRPGHDCERKIMMVDAGAISVFVAKLAQYTESRRFSRCLLWMFPSARRPVFVFFLNEKRLYSRFSFSRIAQDRYSFCYRLRERFMVIYY